MRMVNRLPSVFQDRYIAGVQVARGYLNRPELMAEKFLTDRFTSHAANKMMVLL